MEIENILLIIIASTLAMAVICMSFSYLCNAEPITQTKIIPDDLSSEAEMQSDIENIISIKTNHLHQEALHQEALHQETLPENNCLSVCLNFNEKTSELQ